MHAVSDNFRIDLLQHYGLLYRPVYLLDLPSDPFEMVVLSFGCEDRGVAQPVADVVQCVLVLGAKHPPGDAVAERVRTHVVGVATPA